MAKITLIVGAQASGKTTKAAELLSKYKTTLVTPSKSLLLINIVFSNYEAICFEELTDINLLQRLINHSSTNQTDLIITTQLKESQLPEYVVSSCNIIQL